MKIFLKFAAIAAIMALAVISCSPPDVLDPHYEYWDQINEQYDSSSYTLGNYTAAFTGTFISARSINAAGVSVPGYLSINTTTGSVTAAAENYVEITITDPTADIFKADNAETVLKEFLSFYTYNPNEIAPEELGRGKAHTLTAYTGWALERKRSGDTFVLKLTAPFTASSSNLVWKIDSTKYTYRGGLKMDKDGNGIPAEPFYDDFYGSLTVNGLTNSTAAQLPGNRGITVSLPNTNAPFIDLTTVGATTGTDDVPAGFNFPAVTDTVVKEGANIQIVLSSSITNAFLNAEDKDDILISLLSGIKIEEFTEAAGDWKPSKFYASFDESSKGALANGHRVIIKDFKPAHMTAYRVVFEKSSVSLETNKEFFGVKQRITVNLNGSVNGFKTSLTRLSGEPRLYNNPLIRGFKNLGDTNYVDNTGTSTTWYTYWYKWSPGYIKSKVLAPTTIPNPNYDAAKEALWNAVDQSYSPGKSAGDPDYDATKEAAWAAVDQSYSPGKTPYTVNPSYNARKAVAASLNGGVSYTVIGESAIQAIFTSYDLNKEWAGVNYNSAYNTSLTPVNPLYDPIKAVAALLYDEDYIVVTSSTISASPSFTAYDLDKEWAADTSNFDSGYSSTTTMTLGDPAYDAAKEAAWAAWNAISPPYTPGKTPPDPDYDAAKEAAWAAWNAISPPYTPGQSPTVDGPSEYQFLPVYYPSTVPDSVNTVALRTTLATAPTTPIDPKLPAYSDWVWAGVNTPWLTASQASQVGTIVNSLTTSETVYGDETRSARLNLERSNDQNGQNVVLRLEIGPNSITKDGVNTRYYAKQLDLETFKKNFKILYSKGSNSSAAAIISGASDVVEINIVNVEFKQEKTGSDKFDTSDPKVAYSGYNVIYVTLDPNYKYNNANNRTKYVLAGNGFAYNDGINGV
jgi:hypothetical protein